MGHWLNRQGHDVSTEEVQRNREVRWLTIVAWPVAAIALTIGLVGVTGIGMVFVPWALLIIAILWFRPHAANSAAGMAVLVSGLMLFMGTTIVDPYQPGDPQWGPPESSQGINVILFAVTITLVIWGIAGVPLPAMRFALFLGAAVSEGIRVIGMESGYPWSLLFLPGLVLLSVAAAKAGFEWSRAKDISAALRPVEPENTGARRSE